MQNRNDRSKNRRPSRPNRRENRPADPEARARARERAKEKNRIKNEKAGRVILGRTLVVMTICGVVLFLPLFATLYNLMITDHDYYESLATNNQTRSTSVSASRGTVYDRNMNVLSMSASVENVFIDPNEIATKDQDLDLIASGLAALLDVDADWVKEQAADTSMRYKIIKRKIDTTLGDEVRAFINENELSGIYLEPDTKRYYPSSSLAAQVLGFVSSDNVGIEGIEAQYDSYLTGTAGEIITTKGNNGTEMLYEYEKYYEASDGDSLVLTIDSTVQYYLEKNLEEAIEQYDVLNGAFGIVMDVNTGEVLAMATLGSYDPNNYLEIYDADTAAELEEMYQEAISHEEGSALYNQGLEEYNTAVASARLKQWRNRCVSDGYEPGSTFKILTLAAALEEGTTTLEDTFYCGGTTTILGREENNPLHCWKAGGHGSETTAQALQNSCNIAFADIGIALGGDNLYDYVEAFGLLERTGIDLPGEASGIFFDRETLNDPNSYASLTSASFGQTFRITPIQLVRAISAVVNGGYLLEPYVVSEILDSDGNTVQKNTTTVLRQVISEETSAIMCELLESVVTEGTAGNAAVAGYRIGGKTGTSEKIDTYDENGNPVEDKIVSFVGIAPIDDPQYICLVALDTPSTETGYYISGGIMAAPTCRDVFADILPYLGVTPEYSESDIDQADMTVPDVTGMTESEAAAALSDRYLNYRVVGSGTTVTEQVPSANAKIPGRSTVVLYMGEEAPSDLITVPDLTGMTVSQANAAIANSGQLYLKAKGSTASTSSVATDQEPAAGSQVERGTVITVEFTDMSAQD